MKKEKFQTHIIKELEEARIRAITTESGKKLQRPACPAGDASGKVEKPRRRKTDKILIAEGAQQDLELGDIINFRAIQSLMDNFYLLARIPMSIIDLKGKVLAGVGWQEICTKFHRVNPETCRHCIESDTQLTSGVPAGKSKLYRCKNNMWDAATPIMIGDKKMGNIFSGQFFFDTEQIDYELFRSQARRYGFPEKEYIVALNAVPKLSRKSLDTAMAFFANLAQMLSHLSYSNMNLVSSLEERDVLLTSLKAAEEKYHGIFDNSLEGICRTTPDGRIIDANPASARILGYDSPEEMMNVVTNVLQQIYINPNDRIQWLSAIAQQDNASLETQMRKKDGGICWMGLKARAVRDHEGKIIYYEGFSEDITGRKETEAELAQYRDHLEALVKERTAQLEETNEQLLLEIVERKKIEDELKKFKTISDKADYGVSIINIEGEIIYCNEVFAKMHGYLPDELIGVHFSVYHTQDQMTNVNRLIKQLNRKGSFIAEAVWHKRKDDSVFPTLMTGTLIKNANEAPLFLACMAIDITERKKSEEALKKREYELEAKSRNLEELNTALKVLVNRVEEDKIELEEGVLMNIKQLILPYVRKLKKCQLDEKAMTYANLVESNLKSVTSSFSKRLSAKFLNFTPKEIEIANLIKEGKTTKEIAEILNTSPGTIDFHRDNIRRKFNLNNKKINLRSYLMNFS